MSVKVAERGSHELPTQEVGVALSCDPTELAMAESIGPKLEKYLIDRPISSGGMGTVYLAEDTSLHRKVALKVLAPELADDPERFQRFRWEAQVLARLNHPNIVTIYSVEEADGHHFLTMELIEGQTLADQIPQNGLRLDRFFELAIPLADALAAAHQQGVIHRDLKPGNVMVGKDGRVKILDFGLAKQLDDSSAIGAQPVTQDGALLGTIPYMSPEQLQGEAVDHRTDLFSLGILLFEMATGVRPFQGRTFGDLASAILRDNPPSVTVLNVTLPRHLGRIIRHCLEKDPERRFQTALDLRNELEELRREWQTGELEVDAGELDKLRARRARTPRKPAKRPLADERWLTMAAMLVVVGFLALLMWFRATNPEINPLPTGAPQTLVARDVQRIVVLPLENLGPAEHAYFAAGITDEITSRLAAARGLQVISRTTAQGYDRQGKTVQEIGQELGVDYLLEGSVRWSTANQGASRVRVTSQLIRVADDSQLWSERYERVLDDLFTVQSEIAEQVIQQLDIELREPERQALASRPTQHLEAYQAYLQGMDLTSRHDPTPENWQRAISMFEQAVEIDPAFALAWAELAEAHAQAYHLLIDRTPERLERARAAVDRALELAPELPDAHRALGYYYYWGHSDYEQALDAFARAAVDLPNDSQLAEGIAFIRRRQGRFDEALRELEKALRLDPQSARLASELAATYTMLRRYEEAERYYRRSMDLNPAQAVAYQGLALNNVLATGDLEAARELLTEMPHQEEPSSAMAWYYQEMRERNYTAAIERLDVAPIDIIGADWAMLPKNLLRADAYRRMGDERQALAAYRSATFLLERIVTMDFEDPRRRSALARAYSGLGKHDQAVNQAQLAVDLSPPNRDAVKNRGFVENLAEILMLAGQKERAIEQLQHLLSEPSNMSPELLRVDPRWDDLRDHPRFADLLGPLDPRPEFDDAVAAPADGDDGDRQSAP